MAEHRRVQLTDFKLLQAFWLSLIFQAICKYDHVCRHMLPAREYNAVLQHFLDFVHLACHPACPCKFEDTIIRLPCTTASDLLEK